jgi:hypothetical protein
MRTRSAPTRRRGISPMPVRRYAMSAAAPTKAVISPFTAVLSSPYKACATMAMMTGEMP